MPQLSALSPEQILEVREVLKDTKEGFTLRIYEAVEEVEQRLKSGDPSEVVAAQKTVERNLLPWYFEMRRQFESQRTGFWSRALAFGGKLLQIDASPSTPKFWGQIIEAFSGGMSETAKAEARSNAGQAFQYLAKVEAGPPQKADPTFTFTPTLPS